MDRKLVILFSAVCGLLLGGLLVLLFPASQWWISWISSALLIGVSLSASLWAVQAAGNDNKSYWLTLAAFFFRLVIGAFLLWALPAWGYDTEQQNAGYLFQDAFVRDTAAWQVADSGASLVTVFSEGFSEDQYGGMAFLSAAVYRVFSPEVHRPYLILILTSAAFAMGAPFFYSAVKARWSEKLATAAGWLAVLYPEGIFYTVSHMREPILIGMAMILFWGMVRWFEHSSTPRSRRKTLLLGIPAGLLMMLVSWLTGAGILLVLAAWFWVEHIIGVADPRTRRRHWLIAGALGLVGAVGGYLVLSEWLHYSIWWDMRLMTLTSGWLVKLIEGLPVSLQYAITTVYGVFQVVLPAALIDNSLPLWKVLASLRSAGWYLLLPTLLYGILAVWREKDRSQRWVWITLLGMSWLWILFSSMRAGGDMWDNPRYRTVYLPWLVLLAAYLWQNRNHWFWRVIVIEAAALAVFTQWYLARYMVSMGKLPLKTMIGGIILFAAAVIASGLWQEWRVYRNQRRHGKIQQK